MNENLIIEDNSVYEIVEECMKQKKSNLSEVPDRENSDRENVEKNNHYKRKDTAQNTGRRY